MKKVLVLLSLVSFISCVTDSSQSTLPVTISGYRIESSSNSSYSHILTGTLVNNKLFSEANEIIQNGVSKGQNSQQLYFYSNNLLEHYTNDNRTIYFYYDVNNNLIGATGMYNNGNQLFYRFINQPNNIVYCEKINLPYDNSSAIILQRSILKFDTNDEVISAGFDNNLDGLMDNINNFNYSNNNLMAITFYDGNSTTYSHSNIIDTFQELRENSFGKKVTRLICSETFCGLNYNLKYSKNVLSQDALSSTFQVLPNNYYEIKTEILNGVTTTTQFFF